jgi:hypothetical protein
MSCPDCGGTSSVEVVSILLAGLAFVVSFMSLWLTSLRWPRVEVEHLPDGRELRPGVIPRVTKGMPQQHTLTLSVFAYNTGASATVVRRFVAEDFAEDNAGASLFAGMGAGNWPVKPAMPLALERDDAEPAEFRLGLRLSAPDDPEEYARRLAGLRSVRVTLRWSFRGRRFPRKRVWIEDHTDVTVSAAALREEVLPVWRAYDDTAHLADIAEGREPA